MKLVIISDTHCQQFPVPEGDVLIHCGDHTFNGSMSSSWEALNWLSNMNHPHKIIIAGNHELGWEFPVNRMSLLEKFPNLTYLHDSGVEIEGKKFWGSPYQPHFYHWAFQKARGEELRKHWEQMPEGLDVLITHGPPFGFGDLSKRDERFGDEDLLKAVLQKKPKIHCFGHNHAGYGQWFFEGIHFINAASLSDLYQYAHPPVEVELE